MATAIGVYDKTQYITCSLLILIYVVTLIRSIRGQGFAFVTKLLVLLILSNFFAIMTVYANEKVVPYDHRRSNWVYV